jgi:hypothetical protein
MSQPSGHVLLHTPRFSKGSTLTEQGLEVHDLEGPPPAWPIAAALIASKASP